MQVQPCRSISAATVLGGLSSTSTGDQCVSERVDCGSRMVRLYGLDFWRADLVPTLDFSRLLSAVHSVDEFSKFCQYVVSSVWTEQYLFFCGVRPCVCLSLCKKKL